MRRVGAIKENAVAVGICAMFFAASAVAIALATPAHSTKKKPVARKRGPAGPHGPQGAAGAAGAGPATIAFAPTGCTEAGSAPSAGCEQDVSLPGGLNFHLRCGTAGAGAQVFMAVDDVPDGSTLFYNETGGATSGTGVPGDNIGYNATLFPLTGGAGGGLSDPGQYEGQFIYRNGATVLTGNFHAFVSNASHRCEFFLNAVGGR